MAASIDELVLVVVGSFNPAILHPAWLADRKLISRTAAENAEVALIHPAVAQFRCNDLTLYVDQNRLQISTQSEAASPLLRDLAIGIFSILEHTPVTACGINRTLHLPAAGFQWGDIERVLVQRETLSDLLSEAKTTSLRVSGRRPGAEDSMTQVTLEPSAVVPGGVYFAFNEHHAQPDATVASFVEHVLNRHWMPAHAYFRERAHHLMARRSTT